MERHTLMCQYLSFNGSAHCVVEYAVFLNQELAIDNALNYITVGVEIVESSG